jgi:hypothetical protein
MKQGNEALNASSLQFLSSIKFFNASSLQFFLSVKLFIAVTFYRKTSFNASLPLLLKRNSSFNASLPLLFKVTLPTSGNRECTPIYISTEISKSGQDQHSTYRIDITSEKETSKRNEPSSWWTQVYTVFSDLVVHLRRSQHAISQELVDAGWTSYSTATFHWEDQSARRLELYGQWTWLLIGGDLSTMWANRW